MVQQVTPLSDGAFHFPLQTELLGTLLANLDGMAYRMRIDEHWTIEFVSQGCLALTGHPPEHLLLNSRISYEEITHPDDRLHVRKNICAALGSRNRYDIEYRIVRNDGQIRWVSERGSAIVQSSHQPMAIEGFIQDITHRKQAEEALREAEQRYRRIFENSIEGIFQSTRDKGYLVVNPALARIYGYDSPAELMESLHDIEKQVYVDSRRRTEFMQQVEKTGKVTNFESQIYKKDGTVIWISENARSVFSNSGEVLFYEGTVEDITERKLQEAKIEFQATHDSLTGLPNRTLLYDRMEQAVLKAQRHRNFVAVVFIDLDQFKYINDSLGHQVGDQFLCAVANRLTHCIRGSDTVARQGGDEFVLLLTDQVNILNVTQTLQRILTAVSTPWCINGIELQITCSMGVSLCPTDANDPETMLKHADAAMYKAKELGRNNFKFFSTEMNSSVVDRLDMMTRLRHALVADEFVLHYQPKVHLPTGKLIGAEALIRWQPPGGNMVPPGQFIPLAEETGLIIQIGEWVLRKACAQNSAWQTAGYAALPVSVNLSPLQLERDNIVDLVSRVLRETELQPHFLELEITESAVMGDLEKSFAKLRKLKEIGVRISVDDFGTGYSSLSYLKRFPVDTLKIDQSFVRDISSDSGNAGIVKAIISLGHTLNLNVLAEGVETEDEYRFLQDNHCDEMQGYYLSKPVAQAEFVKMLQLADQLPV